LAINVLLIFLLSGCSGKDPDDQAGAAGEPQHVWKEQVKALDKARGLEQEMNAAYKKKAQQIEQQALTIGRVSHGGVGQSQKSVLYS
jgi:ABC-type sulfate transport system substrate-binding protein